MAIDLAQTPAFQRQLGLFYAAWSSTEFMMDYAIGVLLHTAPDQTHLLTSGMDYGRKIRLLVNGWKNREHKNKSTIVGCLNYFQNEGKRNIFAHSFMLTSDKAVLFIERGHSTPYYVKEHSFTLESLTEHVAKFIEKSRQFREALSIDVRSQDFLEFRAAALSLVSKDPKSQASAAQPKSKA